LDIPADAVRVWRGFRAPEMELDAFFTRLGAVFVPATVEMQIEAGLDAYIPSVPAALPDKPESVPDETAILFWDSQQTYTDGFNKLAVRTYTLTHGAVYTPTSGAAFPVLFDGALVRDQPIHLVDHPADWMTGSVRHLIGSRPDGASPAEFATEVAGGLSAIQAAGAVDGAIACAGEDYLVYWALGGDGDDGIDALARLCDWHHIAVPVPTRLEKGMWDEWPGMTVKSGDSFNMQFARRWEH
jgi:hypothetical protein